MITETITFRFENEEQQHRFHARLNGVGVVPTDDAKALLDMACAKTSLAVAALKSVHKTGYVNKATMQKVTQALQILNASATADSPQAGVNPNPPPVSSTSVEAVDE